MGFTLLAFLLTALPLAHATDFPEDKSIHIDSDSGIRGPAYDVISQSLQRLAQTYPDLAQTFTYGRSRNGKNLTLIKIAKKNVPTISAKAVYIGGSIHGDEYLNIEDRLPEWFLQEAQLVGPIQTYLNSGGVIYIAPILNPDGYDRRERENAQGVDLNRDYRLTLRNLQGFQEPETKGLYEYLKRDLEQDRKSLKVALDYHCCIGALLYPWSFTGYTIPEQDRVAHENIGRIMQSKLGTSVRFGTTPVILGYNAYGTSKDFYYETFGALGFTYEGRRNVENRYFSEHTAMWTEIIKTLIQ